MAQEPITINRLLNEEQMDHKLRLYAKVTILPGETLAFHEHHGETETYHILSGAASTTTTAKRSPRTPAIPFSARTAAGTASPAPARNRLSLWRSLS